MASACRLALAVAAALLLSAAPAAARWERVGMPPGTQGSPGGFAASGDTWVLFAAPSVSAAINFSSPGSAYVSRDGGASWQRAAFNAPQGATPDSFSLVVGPDAAFYVPVRYGDGAPGLMRMARNGNAFDTVPLQLPPSDRYVEVSKPAWDGQGRMWIGFSSTADHIAEVDRIASDGSVAERLPVDEQLPSARRIGFFGGRMYVDFGHDLMQRRGNRVVPVPRSTGPGTYVGFPILASGRSILTEAGASIDGGDSFGSRFAQVGPVDGTDRLARLLIGNQLNSGRILMRWSNRFYIPTALTVPLNTLDVWQTSHGLVALLNDGLEVSRGPIPKLRTSAGLPAVARAMVARANYYRHQAGLPPVVGDRLISKASHNHAAYWARRGLNFRSLKLSAHYEQPGTKGFTGVAPIDRCKHVGAECAGEVINFGNQSEHPVDSWVATPYHRAPFIDPATAVVGAARIGRVGVMNFSQLIQGLALAPVEFPIGRYHGPLAFPGNESPDPLAACRAVHQPLGPSPSIPVSFVPPMNTEKPPVVRLFRGHAAVPGCTKVGYFMGRSHLLPHTRYTAKATWQPAGGGPTVTTAWSFTTP